MTGEELRKQYKAGPVSIGWAKREDVIANGWDNLKPLRIDIWENGEWTTVKNNLI